MKRQKIHFYFQYGILLLMVFAMPLQRTFLPPLMLLLSFNWVVEVLTDTLCLLFTRIKKQTPSFQDKWKTVKENRLILPLLLFTGLFVLYCIGLLYSDNMTYGINDIVLKLPFLAMPLILFTSKLTYWTSKRIKIFFNTFITGCLIAVGYNIYSSYIIYSKDLNVANFFYTYGSFLHHPSYASMMYTLAIAVMIYFLLHRKTTIIEKIFYLLCFPVFIGDIFLLSSKTAFFVLAFLFVVLFFYILFQKRIKKINLLYIFLIILIGGTLYSYLPKNFNRFLSQMERINHLTDFKKDTRYTIWTNALEVAKNNLPWGTGTGDSKASLKLNYAKNLHFDYYLEEFNCHNQYLQLLVTLGFLGFFTFIAGQIYSIWIAHKKNYFLYVVFTLIISVNFLTESMLERQVGVAFFAIFNALLCMFAFAEPKKE